MSFLDQALAFLAGGSKCVQLRAKTMGGEEILPLAHRIQECCDMNHAQLIVNDHPRIAKAVGAGVHLGQTDGDPMSARRLLGDQALLGQTVNSIEAAKRAVQVGVADYAGVGPWRFTTTKTKLAPVLDLGTIRQIIEILHPIPAILIGAVRLSDVPAILDCGAHGLAVSSALFDAQGPMQQTECFLSAIKESKI